MKYLPSIVPFLLLSFTLVLWSCSGPGDDPAASAIRERLSKRPLILDAGPSIDSISSHELLKRFYERRQYRPAWVKLSGGLADAESLLSMVKSASLEGLDEQLYHAEAIQHVLAARRKLSPEGWDQFDSSRVTLDLLLTDAFFLFAGHLSEGVVDRDSLRLRRVITDVKERYAELLEKALADHNVADVLRSCAPNHSYYKNLRDLLAAFRIHESYKSWTRVPSGFTLKAVAALRTRLQELGDLHERSAGDEIDSALVDALRIFQRRNGLVPTGITDSATIIALNTPVSKRIEQVRAAMERWRWLPRDLGDSYLLVNIPDYTLQVVEGEKPVMVMKVVLGLPTWQTPLFSSAIEQVLFNSHWMAPEDIVEKELINYMKADTNYLPSNQMSLWRRSGDSLARIDPRTINWVGMTPEKIDFFLRQEGGPQNIMGQIKFLLPNKYNVYLHDTPYRDDFPKVVRMFSHGCIRLEKPVDLAEYVLRRTPEWSRARIDTVVARRTEHAVTLKSKIPVYVFYGTVWREQDGSIQFRDDCYGLDRRLSAILVQPKSGRLSAVQSSSSPR